MKKNYINKDNSCQFLSNAKGKRKSEKRETNDVFFDTFLQRLH